MSPRPSELRVYNTRTRSVEPFVPIDGNRVRIYVCGLTPSAEAHLGHARSFMFFDVVRRYLTHRGYRVTYVQNVTDIDDRSIAAARTSGVPWTEIVEGYFASFKRSMSRLRVLEPDREPRATAYVPEIVAMIGDLIARENAYVAPDGVYFAVASFPRYGALSGRNTEELLIGARIAPDEGKRDPLDFALWKFAKPGEPSWDSPWGAGRPGWHIECSAMSHALLGEPFDIHGGGYDLIFPHHENEVAQTESLAPPPMANVWMHGGLLQFDGKKMSKSLGNFEPLHALLDRHDPQAIRLLFLRTGYRKPMNFTEPSIESARSGLEKLLAAYDRLRHAPRTAAHDAGVAAHGAGVAAHDAGVGAHDTGVAVHDTRAGAHDAGVAAHDAGVAAYRERFYAYMDDDFNTAGAVAALSQLAGEAEAIAARGSASAVAAFMHEAMTVLGISPNERLNQPKTVKTLHYAASATASGRATAAVTVDAASARHGDARHGDEGLGGYKITRRGEEHLAPGQVERLRQLVGEIVPLPATGPDAVDAVVKARADAKSQKDFALADRLRGALADAGVVLADSKEGTSWSVDA